MPRKRPGRQPRGGAASLALRGLGLALLGVLLLLATGADEPGPPRPPGTSAVDAVAMALELALLAGGDWQATPGGLDEARQILQQPDLPPTELRERALAAAGHWSARSEPARRLYAAWSRMEQVEERIELIDDDGQVGQLARLGLAAEFCVALEGSTHLPPAQAAGLLARSAAAPDAVAALELVGRSLQRVEPTTLVGAHQRAAWERLLAVARVPGPVDALLLPRADGLPVDRPTAPILRIEPARLSLEARSLVSFGDGRLSVDRGPPPDQLDGWSPSAWQRWQVIAQRRTELSLAGVTALLPAHAHRASEPTAPNIVADPDLPLARLVEVLAPLHSHGVERACLLVRPAEHRPVRQVCAPFHPSVPADGVAWSLGPGGLYAGQLPRADAGASAWAVGRDGARVEDLVLALEEARHAGRSLGLAAEGLGPSFQE